MSHFVRGLFSEYYTRCSEAIRVPSFPERREYGAMLPDQKLMIRHRALADANSLIRFLSNLVPSDVYYSVAQYEKPDDAEMSGKGWRGADLVFDIDADHIQSECEKTHDEWTCTSCGLTGSGVPPTTCPSCWREKFRVKVWPCSQCIDAAKQETVKLLDILIDDFGFSKREIQVYFSGHRGYHVHVEGSSILELDAMARKEIVDYVIGLGVDTEFLECLQEGNGNSDNSRGTKQFSYGWRRRAALGVGKIVAHAGLEDYEHLGIIGNSAKILSDKKHNIARGWETAGFSSHVKGLGGQTLKKLFEGGCAFQSSKIDTVVTTDIHRLIRLAGSLHGKTGLRKAEVSISGIDSFDPFKSAVAFSGSDATVFVESAPEFRIGDETFGPFDAEKATLPIAAALLLVCKKRAKVID